jgi:hypothetical protein
LRTLAIISIALTLTACNAAGQRAVTFDPPYPERSADGAPILAVFNGRLPCNTPGCGVRKVTLVLYEHATTKARAYWLGVVRVDGSNDRDIREGTWRTARGIEGYPNALTYEVEATPEPDLKRFWRVSDDILIPLDEGARPKAGDAAWGNMLSRDAEPYGPRSYVVE